MRKALDEVRHLQRERMTLKTFLEIPEGTPRNFGPYHRVKWQEHPGGPFRVGYKYFSFGVPNVAVVRPVIVA